MITCDGCGFQGEAALFRMIGNVMCCGPLVFRACPRCGNKVICDRQEMQEGYEEKAREMARRLEEAMGKGMTGEAEVILRELTELNRCLNLAPLDDFIRMARRRIKRAGAPSS